MHTGGAIKTKGKNAADLLNEIKQEISLVRGSADWMRWVTTMSKFWTYSFRNQFLIALQFPLASRLAGYLKWAELGRHVLKGQRAIRILAPLKAKIEEVDKATGEVSFRQVIRGFRVVSIFDISQTDGQDLPTIHRPLQGEAPSGMFAKAKDFIQSKGFSVSFQPTKPGLYGFVTSQKSITLREGESPAQSLATLIHESAHALLGHVSGDHFARDEAELAAETTSLIVCRNLGMATDKQAFGYLASWSQNDEGHEKLTRAAQKACAVAKVILTGLQNTAENAS